MAAHDGIISHTNTVQSGPVDLNKAIDVSNVNGRTAFITGGASGIGEALGHELAKSGANIIIGDINEKRGAEVVARLRTSSNGQHHYVRLDVTDWESQVIGFREAVRLSPHGGLDIVVAGAGINTPNDNTVFEITPPKIDGEMIPPALSLKILKVDLEGVLYTATLALSCLSKNPGSHPCAIRQDPSARPRDRHLILISSVVGITGYPANGLYAAAKHGVVGAFRSLRLTAPVVHGVRVNMINPCYVDTPMLDANAHIPLLGVPMTALDRVVEALMRLCADDEIIGRALLVCPEFSEEQMEASGLKSVTGLSGHTKGAIVDILGHDFEQTDQIMRRVMASMNLLAAAKGWIGFFVDIPYRVRRLLHL
jgi:NAD(P)-dependent dehydrogenase (short-subunit alcohol dehydrogenase family)